MILYCSGGVMKGESEAPGLEAGLVGGGSRWGGGK